MIQVILNKDDYEFIIEKAPSFLTEVEAKPAKITDSKVMYLFNTEKDYEDFESGFNFTIVHDGLDNQDTSNDIGMRLYHIYDSMEVYEQ